MNAREYKIGALITNKHGLHLVIREIDNDPYESDITYTTTCKRCNYTHEGTADNLEKKEFCANCEEQPAALKTDADGNCITICDIGTVEFVRDFQDKHNVSERQAVQRFVEIVKAKLPPDDPILDRITEGSIRSKVRRNTGKDKKKATPEVAQSEPESTLETSQGEPNQHLCVATVEGVSFFLKKYLPGYKIVNI